MVRGRGPLPPTPSREQRLQALGQANAIRSAQAQLKRELAAGSIELAATIAAPPAFSETAKVHELLLAVPKVGPVRAASPHAPSSAAPFAPAHAWCSLR